jgi:hypothetical protein
LTEVFELLRDEEVQGVRERVGARVREITDCVGSGLHNVGSGLAIADMAEPGNLRLWCTVRTAAMACLVDVLDVVSPEALKSTVGPKFVEFCGSLSTDPRLVPGLSANIGPMLAKLAPHFGSPSDLEACVQAFCTLGARDEEEVRKKCAASFLTILKVCAAVRLPAQPFFLRIPCKVSEIIKQLSSSDFM